MKRKARILGLPAGFFALLPVILILLVAVFAAGFFTGFTTYTRLSEQEVEYELKEWVDDAKEDLEKTKVECAAELSDLRVAQAHALERLADEHAARVRVLREEFKLKPGQ